MAFNEKAHGTVHRRSPTLDQRRQAQSKEIHQVNGRDVSYASGPTEPFEAEGRLHWGSALCPLLFGLIMDCLTEEMREEDPWQMMLMDDIVFEGELEEDPMTGDWSGT